MRNKTNPKYAEGLPAGRHRVGDAEARPSAAHHYQKLLFLSYDDKRLSNIKELW